MKFYKIFLLILMIVISIPLFFSDENFHHPEFREYSRSESATFAYPLAVGILSNTKNCLVCHTNDGPWRNETKLLIDILDNQTKKSFQNSDGSFTIDVHKGSTKTVLTLIGYSKEGEKELPYRNAWLYIDTATIGNNALSKFANGWDVNLPMACRIVGDKIDGYDDFIYTSLPMTIQPNENAQDAEVILQVMLTKGESVKGKAKQGLIGNYFERKVFLKIHE